MYIYVQCNAVRTFKQKLQLGFEEASLIMMPRTIYYSGLKIWLVNNL